MPFGDIGQCKQVQARQKQKNQRNERQQSDPEGLFLPHQGNNVDDDGDRKGDGQPTVNWPKQPTSVKTSR
jgi:hypothetical protein